MAEHPMTGWEPDRDVGDTLQRRQVFNLAERVRHTSEAMGHPRHDDVDVVAMRGGERSFYGNDAVLLRPVVDLVDAREVRNRLDAFYGPRAAYLLWSAWPPPDLSAVGFLSIDHSPMMVRWPGADAPADPAGLVVEEVDDRQGMAEWAEAIIHGYPLTGLESDPLSLYDERVLGGPFRCFVGRVDGRPVTCAAVMVACGVGQVEWVATLPDSRGRRYGEAVTWRATLAAPDLPAVLVASDLGRSVYERMGYVAVTRMSSWVRDLSVQE